MRSGTPARGPRVPATSDGTWSEKDGDGVPSGRVRERPQAIEASIFEEPSRRSTEASVRREAEEHGRANGHAGDA
jgi:hypothetical protein